MAVYEANPRLCVRAPLPPSSIRVPIPHHPPLEYVYMDICSAIFLHPARGYHSCNFALWELRERKHTERLCSFRALKCIRVAFAPRHCVSCISTVDRMSPRDLAFAQVYRTVSQFAIDRPFSPTCFSFPLPPSSSSVAIEPRVYIYIYVGIFVAKFLSFLKPNVSIVSKQMLRSLQKKHKCRLFFRSYWFL